MHSSIIIQLYIVHIYDVCCVLYAYAYVYVNKQLCLHGLQIHKQFEKSSCAEKGRRQNCLDANCSRSLSLFFPFLSSILYIICRSFCSCPTIFFYTSCIFAKWRENKKCGLCWILTIVMVYLHLCLSIL